MKKVEAVFNKGNESFVSQKKHDTSMTPRGVKNSAFNTTINSKLKEVLAMTPKGEKSELKRKPTTYKSQINLNVKN